MSHFLILITFAHGSFTFCIAGNFCMAVLSIGFTFKAHA